MDVNKNPMGSWQGLITAEELEIYKNAGFLREIGLGSRPAVLVIVAQYNFTGDKPEPITASTKKFRFSCGENAWRAMPQIKGLIALARKKGIPIVYTQDFEVPADPTEHEARQGNLIVDEVKPRASDRIIPKEGYSGFFGTRMLSLLISMNIDTVIIVGGTTSGCIRATAIDAYDYRFRAFVIEDGVFDRAANPHRSNLFDIAAKAANVVTMARMEQMLSSVDYKQTFSGVADSPSWRVSRR
jgi:maleamate amidohydrolase